MVVCQGPASSKFKGNRKVAVLETDELATLASAINLALESTTGEFAAIVNPRSLVEPTAVGVLMGAVGATTDIVYSDERINSAVFAKPAFSPERLRSQFYFGDITAYRLDLLNDINHVRSDVDGAELYDLALRASRTARQVKHVSQALISGDGHSIASTWGTEDQLRDRSIASALTEHLEATGGGSVDSIGADGVHHTRRHVEGEPLVSIVIPTRGDRASIRGTDRCLVVEAVRGVVEFDVPNFEWSSWSTRWLQRVFVRTLWRWAPARCVWSSGTSRLASRPK